MESRKKMVSPYSYVGIMYDEIMQNKKEENEVRFISDISIKEILKIVAEETETNCEEILSDSKKQEIVDARYIYFAALKKKYNLCLERIGELAGNRHHSTIIHGLKKFEERNNYEPRFKRIANNVFLKIGLYTEKFDQKIVKAVKLVTVCLIIGGMVISCNPKMHIIGYGMRKFNTSQNKYTKNKPYIKIN